MMSQATIRLHEVDAGQGLAAKGLNRLRAQRLNAFAGRALGEDEFDRLQAWGDARIAALEGALPEPGILSGLDCRLELQDGEQVIRVAPGIGLGKERELYSLHHSLTRDWVGLRDAFRAQSDDVALNGLYLVLLGAQFFHLDVNPNQAPCRRDELDRLRDARIARGLRLELVDLPPALWEPDEIQAEPLTAANRFLGRLLQGATALPDHAGISVALIGVRNDELLWLDAMAGAFAAVEYPVHAQLRAHLHRAFEQVLNAGTGAGNTPLAAMQSYAPAYLPAAAELPTFLLVNPAGVNPLPRLDWFPADAVQELQVLPESSLAVIMRANLSRAVTPFDQLAGDRYRIGLVLADSDYRDDLMALPRLDAELPDLLRRQGILARNAAADLQVAWDGLAAGFDRDENPDVNIPERPQATEDPEDVLATLGARAWHAKEANADLEAPYSANWPGPGTDLPEAEAVTESTPEGTPDGLLARAAEEKRLQDELEEMLADIDELLEMLEQEKKQQRGIVDTLTVDLAQLAGGVAGDGSGLRIASMARHVDMIAKTGTGS